MTGPRITRESFRDALQTALQHLYNPAALRKSPLQCHLAAGKPDPLAGMRKALLDAIQELKPEPHVPPHANAWRIYHILTYRYVEQLTQKEVATELALSVRQLRRLEHGAVDVLGDALWQQYAPVEQAVDAVPPPAGEAPAPATASQAPVRESELAWLRASLPSEVANLAEVVDAVLETLAPLATLQGVGVHADVPEDLPPVNGPRAPIRQALLNLLSAAVQAVPGGAVQVRGAAAPDTVRAHTVRAHITGTSGPTPIPAGDELREKLTMTRELCTLFGGELHLRPTPATPEGGRRERDAHATAFAVTLTLPAATPVPVLAIDDNADARHLLQRYLEGTRYEFHGIGDPEQALALAERIAPQIIVLDVMLPGVDGWELLGRLRAHPGTHDVPVIVYTILPQEQLALALGADVFLRKPVSREALLEVLEARARH